jgi:hypothetical protein
VNTLPDRIRLHHYDKLTPQQQEVIGNIEASDRLTSGAILNKLKDASVLHWRIDRALRQFNQERNRVIHPIERRQKTAPDRSTFYVLDLKPAAVVPRHATKEDANKYFRYFCHIIDLSGGESPRKNQKTSSAYPSLSGQLRQMKEKRRLPRSSGKDDSA